MIYDALYASGEQRGWLDFCCRRKRDDDEDDDDDAPVLRYSEKHLFCDAAHARGSRWRGSYRAADKNTGCFSMSGEAEKL